MKRPFTAHGANGQYRKSGISLACYAFHISVKIEEKEACIYKEKPQPLFSSPITCLPPRPQSPQTQTVHCTSTHARARPQKRANKDVNRERARGFPSLRGGKTALGRAKEGPCGQGV